MNKLDTVYINMNIHTERRLITENLLNKLGLDYTRQEGRNIETFDFSCGEQPIDLIDLSFKCPITGRNQTKGELGCVLSHINVWKDVVKSGNITLVLEDDIRLTANVETIQEIIDSAYHILDSTDYEFIYIARQPLNTNKETGIHIYPDFIEPRYSWLTHAYMVTPEAAAKLLACEEFMNHTIPSDEWIPFAIDKGYNNQLWSRQKVADPIKALAYANSEIIIQNSYMDQASATMPENSSIIYKTNPISVKYVVATVASDVNHFGFTALMNSLETHNWNLDACFNIVSDDKWGGSDMSGPGGGQKINLLKSFIDEYEMNDDTVLIFVDGYDVLLNTDSWKLMCRWLENFDTGSVTFAAEKSCWPDADMAGDMEVTADERGHYDREGYTFLNSGTFIGRVRDIKTLVNAHVIQDSDDDQLYYQQEYVDGGLIELDHKCLLFQTMSRAMDDVEIDPVNGNLTNTVFGTEPLILHGNGDEETKEAFFGVARTLNQIYNPTPFSYWV
jgi:GR25 family glycosyltransferase involved in LPS biosynthesis